MDPNSTKEQIKEMRKGGITQVTLCIIGGGPAALGFLCSAHKNETPKKSNRLLDIVKSREDCRGLAILESGCSLGGGSL